MRKIRQWYMVLLIFLVFWPCRQGMAAEISIDPLSGVIRPGQAVLISFHVPEEGTADLILRGEDGQTVSVVATDLKVKAGINGVWWAISLSSIMKGILLNILFIYRLKKLQ